MATTSKFDFGLINDQIKTHTDQIVNLGTTYIETGSSASRAYEIDQYYMRENILYRVIRPIASGATFTSSNSKQVENGALNDLLSLRTFSATPATGVTITRFNGYIQANFVFIEFLINLTASKNIYDILLSYDYHAKKTTFFPLYDGATYSNSGYSAYAQDNQIRLCQATNPMLLEASVMFILNTNQ